MINIPIDIIEINDLKNKFYEKKNQKKFIFKKLYWKYGNLSIILKMKKYKNLFKRNIELHGKQIIKDSKKKSSCLKDYKKNLEKYDFL